ncbi:NAD-dependent epimerase/dehydratase family protein, partial [Mycolicibacterium porcinum]|uniref:NAD-dependent epimerase/dehydratase family protein n=1 Tax=Mycolicibacterium porcinum TaxID=39693 RepID=UPI000AA22104
DAIAGVRRSQLRQIVIGGEPVRPAAVDKWVNAAGADDISVVSSYGPTETTVVVSYVPVIAGGQVLERGARRRLGAPVVPNTVVIAFGEVVVVGEVVSDGYLGVDNAGFALIAMPDGRRRRAYATADRVTVDGQGYPAFAGRKDALVKVSGKRVDIAEITRRIVADPAVRDVAVELHNGRLGVWFETAETRAGGEDSTVAARISTILVDLRVPAFIIAGVVRIPRKPNGKTDTARLPTSAGSGLWQQVDGEAGTRATGLAEIWSARLGRPITPTTSLLCEGVGSLDVVRILPDTRGYLDRHVSMLDIIGADTAANLVADASVGNGWMDRATAADVDRDLAAVSTRRAAVSDPGRSSHGPNAGPILVLGASGILGTGFAEAILELTRSAVPRPDVVLAARSVPSGDRTWTALRDAPGVRIEPLVPEFGPAELEALIRRTAPRTLINCIGNTNVVVPYRELRCANVELVAAMAQMCAASGVRLVHLSTYVVNGDVTAAEVVDPRHGPYPYAASKALAELAVSRADRELDFTIVRLPRVLGTPGQLRGSADILLAVVEACLALQAYPAIELTEEVTTGRAAAAGILRRMPEFGGPEQLGRGIDVVRGQAVSYREVLGAVARDEVDSREWKRRLDDSAWAKADPRRWSVIDAWIGLGLKLGARSYSEYLADRPAIPLDIGSVGELVAQPPPVQALLARAARELIPAI